MSSPDSLTESGDVISMCINDEGNLAVLNVANQGVHLWDLQVRPEIFTIGVEECVVVNLVVSLFSISSEQISAFQC